MNNSNWISMDVPVSYDIPVSAIMTTHAWSASVDDTLSEVEKIMVTRNLSSVPIVDSKGTIFGIVSSRDLQRCRAAKTNLRAVQAWEICSYKPIEVGPEVSVQEVAKLMLEKEVAYVIVMENGFIKGFVSTFDFVQRLLEREQ
jgi:CBS domain-containing protein